MADRFHSAADFGSALAKHYDQKVGTPLAIAAVVRGLFKSAGKAESPTASGLSTLPSTWTTRSSYGDTASAYVQSATVTGPVTSSGCSSGSDV